MFQNSNIPSFGLGQGKVVGYGEHVNAFRKMRIIFGKAEELLVSKVGLCFIDCLQSS